ncbi:peptidase inhibitor I78 family-domain-containing protein [Aspergillus cavernicola]|uniref:Peptidase inhibitor I78 family-domain-containing protein n=1 Tax=Aspergillus cavernicola TaxID=176166 RepID=A0ABR4IWX1_9EURO
MKPAFRFPDLSQRKCLITLIRPYHNQPNKMPLVVPGINNTSGSKDEWLNKLVGKKISDYSSDATSFAKKDLPESHRIVKPGDAVTMDHRPERLNIHVDENENVHDVRFG